MIIKSSKIPVSSLFQLSIQATKVVHLLHCKYQQLPKLYLHLQLQLIETRTIKVIINFRMQLLGCSTHQSYLLPPINQSSMISKNNSSNHNSTSIHALAAQVLWMYLILWVVQLFQLITILTIMELVITI